MAEEKGAQKQQMGFWEIQSCGLSNPDEKLSTMNPPPIIGSSSNNNDPLISNQNQQVVDEGDNAGADKIAPLRTSHGARKRTTGKTTAGAGGRNRNGVVVGGGGQATGDHDMHIWTERERRKKMRNMFTDLHALLPQLPPKADKSSIVDEAVRYIKTLENTLENLEKIKQERLKQAKKSADSTATILCDPSQRHRSEVSREAFMADHGGSSIHNSSTYRNSNLASATNAMNNIGTSTSMSLPGGIVNKPSAGFQTWSSSNVVVNICGDQAQFNLCSLKKPGLFTSICTVFEMYKIEVLSAHISSDDHRCFYMIHAQANGGSNQFGEAISAEETFRQAAGEMTLWLS